MTAATSRPAGNHNGHTAAQTIDYWKSYIQHPQQHTSKSQQLYSHLYQHGIPSDLRLQLWLAICSTQQQSHPTHKSHRIPSQLQSELHYELEALQHCPDSVIYNLTQADLQAIQQIVLDDAVLYERTTLVPNYIKLVTRLYCTVCAKNTKYTTTIVHYLSHQFHTYNFNTAIRTDLCAVVELLITDLPTLTHKFNNHTKSSIDVIDWLDLTVQHLSALYSSSQWCLEMTLRMMDVVLVDGVQALCYVVYAFYQYHTPRILQLQDDEHLYSSLLALSQDTKTPDISTILQMVYERFYDSGSKGQKDFGKIRSRKDWSRLMDGRCGAVVFSAAVGDLHSSAAHAIALIKPVRPVKATASGGTEATRFVYASSETNKENDSRTSNPQQQHAQLPEQRKSGINNTNPRLLVANATPDTKPNQELAAMRQQLQAAEREIQRLRAGQSHTRTDNNHLRDLSDASYVPNPLASADGLDSIGSRTRSIAAIASSAAALNRPGTEDSRRLVTHSSAATTPQGVNSSSTTTFGIIKFSELTNYQIFPCVYMEGYLLKARAVPEGESYGLLRKKSDGMNVFGTVHRRFFVLFGNFLTYYKSHTSRGPTRDEALDMRLCSVSLLEKHELGKWAFRISNAKGSIYVLIGVCSYRC